MDYLIIILLGLCIGSFLNVCVYRIPREESIAFPPSHCMKCGYELKAKDLVPVLSYIFLKGKCTNCKDKISIQYPIIELINAVLYLLIYLKFGLTIDTLKFMFLVSIIIVIGIIDYKTKYVYTVTTLFGGFIGLIFFIIDWYQLGTLPKDKLIGFAIGAIVIGLIVFLTHGMGEGDIEIAAMSGLFLGMKATIFMLFSSFILGGIGGIIVLIAKRKGGKDEIAFGPYLAIGTIIAIFFGNKLISMYISYLSI